MDDQIIQVMWGVGVCSYSFQPSSGASRGLVTIWDCSVVDVWSYMSYNNVLLIRGRMVDTGEEFIIFNVYAPCDFVLKQRLWDRLLPLVLNSDDTCLCLCGDSNSIHSMEEMKGRRVLFRQPDADSFNHFILDGSLIDLPLCGRLFTWYHGDGISMSRLDRFLLSNKWCAVWPHCIQVAYNRGLSDHVPLWLHVDETSWGPRPVKMLKCWAYFPGYEDFVRTQWESFVVSGWGGYVLQQKLKLLKLNLKEWHHQHSRNLEGWAAEIKNRMSQLDVLGEGAVLSKEEVEELHELSVNLHSLAKVQTSMHWQ